MSNRPIRVEIVIPVHNRRDTTLRGLRSLSRIDRTGLYVHINVVDDGSSDGTAAAIRSQHPDVAVIEGSGDLHYAGGTNRGIEAALRHNPDFIVTANDDSIFHDKFLVRLVDTATDNPRSVVGALLLPWDKPNTVFQVDFKWKTSAGGWTHADGQSAFDFPSAAFGVEGLAGNCILFPVEAISECGLMDEANFPNGWGDIQYVTRMRRNGWQLLVEPRSLVWCEPNTLPTPLHQRSAREVLSVLFRDRRHPQNLHRQLVARLESAPTRTAAVTAFSMYLLQLVGKTVKWVRYGSAHPQTGRRS